jgi:glutathione S-transferase
MIKFHHAPFSRSSGILWILEELEVTYETHLVDIRAAGRAPESYREIHPHKKVPALEHDGALLIESAAISVYLGDAFPKGTLTPQVGDPRRGPYLAWQSYLASVYDPALCAAVKGWDYSGRETGYGRLADVVRHIERTLTKSPYLTGAHVTLADMNLSGALFWGIEMANLVEGTPLFRDYIARVQDRPSFGRYQRIEQRLAESMRGPLAPALAS